nr:MAG TPA: hypothetical protein [Caudoviricetes sp.]
MPNFISNKSRILFVTDSTTQYVTSTSGTTPSISKAHPNAVFFTSDTCSGTVPYKSGDIVKNGVIYTRVLGIAKSVVGTGASRTVTVADDTNTAKVYIGNNKELSLKLTDNNGSSGYLYMQPSQRFYEYMDGSELKGDVIKLYMLDNERENKRNSIELRCVNVDTSTPTYTNLVSDFVQTTYSSDGGQHKVTMSIKPLSESIKNTIKENWNITEIKYKLWNDKEVIIQPMHNSYVYCGAKLPSDDNRTIKSKLEFIDESTKYLQTYNSLEDLIGRVFYVSYRDYIVLPQAWYEQVKICIANYHSEYFGHITNDRGDLLLNFTKEDIILTDSIGTEYVVLRSQSMNGFSYITFKKGRPTPNATTPSINDVYNNNGNNYAGITSSASRPKRVAVIRIKNNSKLVVAPGKRLEIGYEIARYVGSVTDNDTNNFTIDEIPGINITKDATKITVAVPTGTPNKTIYLRLNLPGSPFSQDIPVVVDQKA